MRPTSPAPVAAVRFNSGLLADRQSTVLQHSIDQQYEQCRTTGRLDAMKLLWTPDSSGVPRPHEFWDSDIAKWIESASYALMLRRDAALEARIDAAVNDIASSQRPDGYFNSFFQAVMPDRAFTNLRDQHELYCAGHLIEAAVAYAQATGKRKLLDVLIRYVDHIGRVFGPEPGQKNGYDGHEEIELALVKLHAFTRDPAHLRLAKHFIDSRGTKPHFFDLEADARGEDPKRRWWAHESYAYYQAHRPIRDQKTLDGHAVRALYMLSGAIDVAFATADKALITACKRLYDNCVSRRMYVNGGVGSTRHGERFTFDFDLPNESAYAETCASIAMIFASSRLLNHTRDGRYADVIERALYNAVLPGISLDGTQYFYANYLATDPRWHRFDGGYRARREGWFECACCPPNLARLFTSLGSYAYSTAPREIIVHLYADSTIEHDGATLTQTTRYPWKGEVSFECSGSITLTLRLPGWCAKPTVKHNGKPVDLRNARKGYLSIKLGEGDRVKLTMPKPPARVYADPRIRHNTGRVAIMRGPLLYCLEQVDNGPDLNALTLPRSARIVEKTTPRLLGGVVTLHTTGRRDTPADTALYTTRQPRTKPAKLTFVPYYAWANRREGEMISWVRER
jgi:DUF1680 family protein